MEGIEREKRKGNRRERRDRERESNRETDKKRKKIPPDRHSDRGRSGRRREELRGTNYKPLHTSEQYAN